MTTTSQRSVVPTTARTASNSFVRDFVAALVEDCFAVQTRNMDWLRNGGGRRMRFMYRAKDLVAYCCERLALVPRGHYDADALAFILDNLDSFNTTFCLLGDSHSRDVLIKVLEYRVLGPRHVKVPLNTAEFWNSYMTINERFARRLRTRSAWDDRWYFNQYEVPVNEEVLRLDAHPLNILNTFVLDQYAYARNNEAIGVTNGDVVIDGGGCYGDTALYFAALAGPTGAVVSFEFMEDNLRIFRDNLSLNAALSKRISVIPKALWNRSGQTLTFDSNGPGTRISSGPAAAVARKVESVSIDDVAKTAPLPRIDFIKLDIEGSELSALHGAVETITRFKPNLAVSLYHNLDDFLTIPQWIQSLGLGYRFYLDHFTIHREETVLFAAARS